MVKDLIEDIRATEAQANRIIEDAKKTRADAVAKAREKAKHMLDESRRHGEQMIKDELSRASEEISRRTAQIAEHQSSDIEAIRTKALPRLAKAVEMVLAKILD
ncbi:MAG: V-type ATPase subunit subunit G family protein [bacterium]